jgi:RNA polymerase sigma factor (sigma-70 family)
MSPSVSIRLLLTQSDARLAQLAREGHERAFEALVQRYRRPLLAYCRRLLLPSERAEDALQQGLLQAWLALQDGTEVREPRAWLYRVVHNAAINMLRVSGYDYATLSETLRGGDAPEQDLDRRIAVREALAGLAALPQMQREALLRTAVDGHSHEQVARALGVSEGALRGLVHRARTSLRAATTALTPSPIVSWALGPRGGGMAPLVARVGELGAGGGSLGVGGILLKGGAVAVTAGALASGIAAVHHASPIPSSGTSPPGSQSALLASAAGEGAHGGAVSAGGGIATTALRDAQAHRIPSHDPPHGWSGMRDARERGLLRQPPVGTPHGEGPTQRQPWSPPGTRDGHDGQPVSATDSNGDRSGSSSGDTAQARSSGGETSSGLNPGEIGPTSGGSGSGSGSDGSGSTGAGTSSGDSSSTSGSVSDGGGGDSSGSTSSTGSGDGGSSTLSGDSSSGQSLLSEPSVGGQPGSDATASGEESASGGDTSAPR